MQLIRMLRVHNTGNKPVLLNPHEVKSIGVEGQGPVPGSLGFARYLLVRMRTGELVRYAPISSTGSPMPEATDEEDILGNLKQYIAASA